jgi:hypothetical protein
MVFVKAHRKQFLLAGSLAAVTAFTVTACGGGSAAAPAQGSAPGQWTQAEVSQFKTAAGSGGSSSQDSCVIAYFERDMSFGNAEDVVSVDSASGTSLSAAQVKAAVVSKYGTAKGDAINAQFGQVVTDSDNNCSGSAAPSTAPAAGPAPTADPAATSESSCTVDCVDPIASGENGWAAQVQAPLQQVSQDLSQIASDESSNPSYLTVDGANLTGDAQAVLNDEIDPAPVDNSDFVAAMNDYIAAGNDYSGDNSSGQQNVTQADQEVAAGTAALKSFEAANTGSSAAAPATSAPASSAAASTTPAAATTASCGTQMKLWYIQYGGKNQIAVFHGTWNGPGGITTDTTLANLHAAGQAFLGATLGPASGSPPACDAVAARAWKTAMTDLGEAGTIEQHVTTITVTPAAAQDANAGFAALATVTAEGAKYAAQP